METIRRATFETNSSSCHSLTITNKENFEAFKNGDLVFHIGCYGVPKDYLLGRGSEDDGGVDGRLLSWEDARDLYVTCMKQKRYKTWRQEYVKLMRWHVNKNIYKLDDITVEDFKNGVNHKFDLVFGGFKDFKKWKNGCENEKSFWKEKRNGTVEMHTVWFNG